MSANRPMASGDLLRRVRLAGALTQAEFAQRGATSRPTLSAYEHGRKSPSLDTFERLISAAGYELDVRPQVSFRTVAVPRGRSLQVPTRLPRLEPNAALAEVELPLTLNWSQPGRVFRLADRGDRARLYELVLREGGPADVLHFVDGVLLVDLWDDLVLPKYVRGAWERLIRNALDGSVNGLVS